MNFRVRLKTVNLKHHNKEIPAQQTNPVKYNPGKIAHGIAFRGAGNEVIYPDKVRINLEYLKHQNFWLDLKIIVYTVLGKRLEESWLEE